MAGMNTAELGVAKGNPGGYAWVAPTGADVPVDATTAIGEDFADLGYITEDGVTNTTEQDTEDHADWSGTVVATSTGAFTETYEVTFMQSSEDVLKVIYGDDNVSTGEDGTISVAHNGSFDDRRAFVFESLITTTRIMRTVIPCGVLSERGDVVQNSSELLGFEATIKALPDDDGNTSYTYIYDSANA